MHNSYTFWGILVFLMPSLSAMAARTATNESEVMENLRKLPGNSIESLAGKGVVRIF